LTRFSLRFLKSMMKILGKICPKTLKCFKGVFEWDVKKGLKKGLKYKNFSDQILNKNKSATYVV
jgi:hypothetical protein